MSRSYKKTPRCGDTKDKFFKKYANRKVRRNNTNHYNHKSYKKLSCSWDICDYETVGRTFEEYWKKLYKTGINLDISTNPILQKRKSIVDGSNGIKQNKSHTAKQNLSCA